MARETNHSARLIGLAQPARQSQQTAASNTGDVKNNPR